MPLTRLVIAIALVAHSGLAAASEAQHAVDEANAALAAAPSRPTDAREAFERAVAAQDDPSAVSQAYFRLGSLDEEDEAYAQALAHYRQCLAVQMASSGAVWPRNASRRMQWLSVRAEGNFAPLARLMRFKRDAAHATDPAAIDALARDTEAFPPGIVRAESRIIVATAWLGPLHRAHDAIRLFRLVAADPTADAIGRRFGERGLVDALIADGQLTAAVGEAAGHAGQLDPQVVGSLHRLERRRRLVHAAQLELVIFLGSAAAVAVYAWWRRRTRRPISRPARGLRIAGALWIGVNVLAAALALLSAFAPAGLERVGL